MDATPEQNSHLDRSVSTPESSPNPSAVPVSPSIDSPEDGCVPDITNHGFLSGIFPSVEEGGFVAVCSISGDPDEDISWIAKRADSATLPDSKNNYFSFSTFKLRDDGTFKARKAQSVSCHGIMLDDIGTKVLRSSLGGIIPTYEIETSPGNYQVGLAFKEPISVIEADQLSKAIIAKGLSDPGAGGPATRWGRLPNGINGKGKYKDENGASFQCRLAGWRPTLRYTPQEIIEGLDLKLPEEKRNVENSVLHKTPPESVIETSLAANKNYDKKVETIKQLMDYIDPDSPYRDWLYVCIATYNETGGSAVGLALFDGWSRKGSKYKGTQEIQAMWKSLQLGEPNPVTIGTLIKMAKDAGADVPAIMGDSFDVCEYEVIHPASGDSNKTIENVVAHAPNLIDDTTSGASKLMDIDSDIEASSKAPATQNPLAKFFLEDITELEKNAMAQVQILGNIALLGQATVLFAQQNTGKTLIIISLIIEGIKAAKFDPAKVIYINMDDDSNGLLTKVRIAEEYGFKMVADGHQGFQAKEFRVAMEQMIASDSARGFIICLDTLKKFVDTMSKKESSYFGKVVRRFVLKGGTVIALAHANKNPSSTGKTVYSGTTDIIDDFDCGYTLTPVKEDRDKGIKIVEFENIKRRGNVALNASYSYAVEPDISYDELLMSVQEVDRGQVIIEKRKNEILSDSDIIKAIETCIEAGINTKMKLVAAAASELPGISNKMVINVIEKYTGNDPVIHRWYYVVKARGAKFFVLPDRPSGDSSTETITSL